MLDLLPTACGHGEKPLQAEAGGRGHHLHLFPDLRTPTFQKGLLYRPEVILWSLVAGDLGQTLGVGSWGLTRLSRAPAQALWAPCQPTHVVAPRGACCSPPRQPRPWGQSCLLASPAPCLALFAPGAAVRATQPPSSLRWVSAHPRPRKWEVASLPAPLKPHAPPQGPVCLGHGPLGLWACLPGGVSGEARGTCGEGCGGGRGV